MTATETQREELSLAVSRASRLHSDGTAYIDTAVAAEAILAAGYRKPRTVTTVRELDALPDKSVVLDGDVCVRRADGRWKVSDLAGVYASREISLPATVLWEPEAEASA